MCGIAGIWPSDVLPDADIVVAAMLRRQAHRGPDGEGVWHDSGSGVTLGHRRLAIIDLTEAASQPFYAEDSQLAITFNGELYNFRELRAELESHGFHFRSQSDTEVLLRGYEKWGTAVLDRLVGMFAFAIWDQREQTLFLARDRTGEKPLYYSLGPRGFAFASELQALRPVPWISESISPEAVAAYLMYQYVPAPLSIYSAIAKLPPAHAMTVRGGQAHIWRYWDPIAVAVGPGLALSEQEALDRLDTLLKEAIRGQMISDVPLGAFLSGGIDSTAVVSAMTEVAQSAVKTFTIGFEETEFNEAHYAEAVAMHLGTDHVTEYVSARDALDLVPQVAQIYGEPFADSSALPTHLVSRVARKEVTVALSGDGGDELFGGYTRYVHLERYATLLRLMGPMAKTLKPVTHRLPGRLARAVPLLGQPVAEVYRGMVSIFNNEEVTRLTGLEAPLYLFDQSWKVQPSMPPRRHAMLADLLTYMPEDILVKVDRAAMRVSLETRAPFLDHRIIEFALRLPLPLVREKHILKQWLYRRVPAKLLQRPKQGFAVPLNKWFRAELRPLLHDYLRPSCLEPLGIQDLSLVQDLVRNHESGSANHGARLWSLLMLAMWGNERHA